MREDVPERMQWDELGGDGLGGRDGHGHGGFGFVDGHGRPSGGRVIVGRVGGAGAVFPGRAVGSLRATKMFLAIALYKP